MTFVYRVLRQLRVPVAIVLGTIGLSALARADTTAVPGVRSTSQSIRELIDDAMWESPTFRGLVMAIAATDGIVYVEEGVCQHSVHACLRLDVTAAAGFRILHILVDLNGVLAHRKRLDLMATIGHELRHALELLAERSIRTSSDAFLFYDRLAPTSDRAFETHAAIAAGVKVRKEVGRQTTFVWQQVALDFPQ
jgi:hypothetical protein